MKRFSPKRAWLKFTRKMRLNELSPPLRRLVVGVIGGTVLVFGITLVVLPGPAFLVIPLGLAILATEFAWARWCVRKGGSLFRNAKRTWFVKRAPAPE